MEFFAHLSHQFNEPPLHGKVHVFALSPWTKRSSRGFTANGLQTIHNLLSLRRRDHPTGRQHAPVGHGSIQILLQQGQVKADGGIEPDNERVQGAFKALAPARLLLGGLVRRWGGQAGGAGGQL